MGSWYDFDEYLQAHHLRGKQHVVTISGWAKREVENQGHRRIRPVLYLKESKKFMYLNKTQYMTLVRLFGEDPDACIGKRIAIQSGKSSNKKDTIDIFAAPAQNSAKPQPAPKPVQATASTEIAQAEGEDTASVEDWFEKMAGAPVEGALPAAEAANAKPAANGGTVATSRAQFWAFVKSHGISRLIADTALDDTGGNYDEARVRLSKRYAEQAA